MDTVTDSDIVMGRHLVVYAQLWLFVCLHAFRACLSVGFVCSPCVEVLLGALDFPFIKYLCYINLIGSSTKALTKTYICSLCTAQAACCSLEEFRSNTENKFHCTIVNHIELNKTLIAPKYFIAD